MMRALLRFDWRGVLYALLVIAGAVGVGFLYAGLMLGWVLR